MTLETMPTLWTKTDTALAERLQTPTRLLVASDFDGTLAPLVPTPEQAAAPPAALAALRALGETPGVTLAIISGRRLDDLAPRVPLPEVVLVGNHGLELRGLGLGGPRGNSETCRPRLERLVSATQASLGDVRGLRIEDKRLTVSIHYREVDPGHHGRVAAVLAGLVAQEPGVLLHHGKMVWELKPDSPWNKGTALFLLRRHLNVPPEATVFLGDDTTDEFAFRALKEGHTFFVGPATTPTAARHRLTDPAHVTEFLDWLVALRR